MLEINSDDLMKITEEPERLSPVATAKIEQSTSTRRCVVHHQAVAPLQNVISLSGWLAT